MFGTSSPSSRSAFFPPPLPLVSTSARWRICWALGCPEARSLGLEVVVRSIGVDRLCLQLSLATVRPRCAVPRSLVSHPARSFSGARHQCVMVAGQFMVLPFHVGAHTARADQIGVWISGDATQRVVNALNVSQVVLMFSLYLLQVRGLCTCSAPRLTVVPSGWLS